MIDISANRQINCTAVYRGTSCHLAAKNRIARSRDAGPQSTRNKHFLSRVGTVTRYWYGIYVRLSVRLSVALWLNCSTYRQTLASGIAIILGFFEPNRHYKIPTVKPSTCMGRLTGGRKSQHFLTEIALYFGHGTTEVHGCCGSLTESHRYPSDPYHVRWLWVTLKGWKRAASSSGEHPHECSYRFNNIDQIRHDN